MSKLSIFPYN